MPQTSQTPATLTTLFMVICYIIVSLAGALMAALAFVFTPATAGHDLQSFVIGLSVFVSFIFLIFVTLLLERIPVIERHSEAWRAEFQRQFKAAERVRIDDPMDMGV